MVSLSRIGGWIENTRLLLDEVERDITHLSTPLYDTGTGDNIYSLLETEKNWLFGYNKEKDYWRGIYPSLEVVYEMAKKNPEGLRRVSPKARERHRKKLDDGIKKYENIARTIDRRYEAVRKELPTIREKVSSLGVGLVLDIKERKPEDLKKKIRESKNTGSDHEKAFHNYYLLVDTTRYTVLVARLYERELVPIIRDLEKECSREEGISPFSFFFSSRDYSHLVETLDSVFVMELGGERVPSPVLLDVLSTMKKSERESILKNLSREFGFSSY